MGVKSSTESTGSSVTLTYGHNDVNFFLVAPSVNVRDGVIPSVAFMVTGKSVVVAPGVPHLRRPTRDVLYVQQAPGGPLTTADRELLAVTIPPEAWDGFVRRRIPVSHDQWLPTAPTTAPIAAGAGAGAGEGAGAGAPARKDRPGPDAVDDFGTSFWADGTHKVVRASRDLRVLKACLFFNVFWSHMERLGDATRDYRGNFKAFFLAACRAFSNAEGAVRTGAKDWRDSLAGPFGLRELPDRVGGWRDWQAAYADLMFGAVMGERALGFPELMFRDMYARYIVSGRGQSGGDACVGTRETPIGREESLGGVVLNELVWTEVPTWPRKSLLLRRGIIQIQEVNALRHATAMGPCRAAPVTFYERDCARGTWSDKGVAYDRAGASRAYGGCIHRPGHMRRTVTMTPAEARSRSRSRSRSHRRLHAALASTTSGRASGSGSRPAHTRAPR
jgi:hypothetical protein